MILRHLQGLQEGGPPSIHAPTSAFPTTCPPTEACKLNEDNELIHLFVHCLMKMDPNPRYESQKIPFSCSLFLYTLARWKIQSLNSFHLESTVSPISRRLQLRVALFISLPPQVPNSKGNEFETVGTRSSTWKLVDELNSTARSR